MHSNTKISALINLLDDPDEQIHRQVCEELLEMGNIVVPLLEDAWEDSFDAILQERIEQIIHNIQFQCVLKDFQQWAKSKEQNLLEAAIIISRYQYPDLDEDFVNNFVHQLTQDVWLELNDEYTAMEKAEIINKVFFQIYNFHGNKKHYHSPKNSFINNVLESRSGNPLSLSIIYLEVAQRLKIPIYGVNLPEYFILAYLLLPLEYLKGDVTEDHILFYINTFSKGSFFQKKEIKRFLEQLNLEMKNEYVLPCNRISIINRLLNNLIYAYQKNGYLEKVNELEMLRNCLPNSNNPI